MSLSAQKCYWAAVFSWLIFFSVSAQDSTDISGYVSPKDFGISIDSSSVDTGLVYVQHVDSLWLEYLNSNTFILDFENSDTTLISLPQTSDQYKKGFEKLDALTPLNLSYNPLMDGFINEYLRYGYQLSKLLGLAHMYFPEMEEILDKNDIPLEIRNLSVVESALNPRARSHRGATGLWQFMLPTGKECGLKINSYIDERRDPVKSTEAACIYLKRLYKIYGEWELAIAAYNCGPGNVNKAIRNAGGSKNFWKIRPYLPRETQKYVPKFMALCYLMEYGELHGVTPHLPDYNYWQKDTVIIKERLRFDQITEFTSVSIDDLRNLNPQFKQDVIPSSEEGRVLYLPAVKVVDFLANEDKFRTHKPENKPAYVSQPVVDSRTPSSYSGKKTYYTVRSGDVLGTIAERHNVSVSQLKRWNRIRGTRIKVGQKLVLYGADKTATVDKPKQDFSSQSDTGDYTYHTVRKGDTLWDIAKLYAGVSTEDIKRLNRGINPNNLKMGSKLKIKKI
ncbi:MAG: LysM peptidoglycan-binding domain-containing protein [Flavobacteriales bacterium]